jgi:heat shock protein HslJ
MIMRPGLTATFVALALSTALLSVAGCGGSGSGASTLEGTAWRLSGWTLSSLDPNDFTITAQFADGKISGGSGVNTYGGPYSAGPGNAFSVGDLAVTAMGGLGSDMRAEQAYLTLLAEARSYKRESGGLTLFDKNGNESLIFKTQEP